MNHHTSTTFLMPRAFIAWRDERVHGKVQKSPALQNPAFNSPWEGHEMFTIAQKHFLTRYLVCVCVSVCHISREKGSFSGSTQRTCIHHGDQQVPFFFVLCVCAAPATPLLQSIGLLILRISLTSLASQVEILAEHGRNILRLVVLESIVDGILAQKAVDCTVVSLAR